MVQARMNRLAATSLAVLAGLALVLIPTKAFAWSEYERMNNGYYGDHYYTASQSNVVAAKGSGYGWEGMTGYTQDIQTVDDQPLYGAYKPSTVEHFYTVSAAEYNSLPATWNREGISSYVATSQTSGTTPFYRILRTTGKHFYTSSKPEHDYLIAQGNIDEGIAGYMYLSAPQVVKTYVQTYSDGRPAPIYRQPASDQGIVLRHGDTSDKYGARDAYVYAENGTYYLTYDGADGSKWSVNEATSSNLQNWAKLGSVFSDSPYCGCYGTQYKSGNQYLMYYLSAGSQAPDTTPGFPYSTQLATGLTPTGPWIKQGQAFPLTSYYSDTASPGPIIQSGNQYLMFLSVASGGKRGIAIARASSPAGPWTPDSAPIIPESEQVENASLYQQGSTWYLFVNHVGLNGNGEYTDSVWMYWSNDLNTWNKANKAVVIDGQESSWSKMVIGLPSVVTVNGRLAVLYDGKTDSSQDHLNRDIGLSWVNLPIVTP